jgi:hypothetical protein
MVGSAISTIISFNRLPKFTKPSGSPAPQRERTSSTLRAVHCHTFDSYGPPGLGKTLSATHYSRIQKIVPLDRWNAEASDEKPIDTVLFTPEVVNTPARIEICVRQARSLVCSVAKRATRAEQRATLDVLRRRDEAWRVEHRDDRDYRPNHPLPLKPTYYDTLHEYDARLEAIPDPTTLIICRLSRSPGDEQSRATALHLRSKRLGYGIDRHAWN